MSDTPETSVDDGGPAFPFVLKDAGNMTTASYGMSLRDWFAGMAMNGALSDPDIDVKGLDDEGFAKLSYSMADAMLQARSNP